MGASSTKEGEEKASGAADDAIGEAGESHGRERNAIGKGGLARTKEAGQRGRADAHERSGASAHGSAFPKQSRENATNITIGRHFSRKKARSATNVSIERHIVLRDVAQSADLSHFREFGKKYRGAGRLLATPWRPMMTSGGPRTLSERAPGNAAG